MMPDREPYDQDDDDTEQQEDDDTEQQEPADGVEVADINVALYEGDISDLVTLAILQGLSSVDEGILAAHQASFSGPLPPPKMMSDYAEVVQDGAERIMAMAEKRQDAVIADRQEDRRAERRGQNYSLVFVLAVLAVGAVGMVVGQPILGSSVTILCLASVVYAFVRGRS